MGVLSGTVEALVMPPSLKEATFSSCLKGSIYREHSS